MTDGRAQSDEARQRRSDELSSEVSFGDLIEAMVHLRPTPTELERIARMLGITAPAPPPVVPPDSTRASGRGPVAGPDPEATSPPVQTEIIPTLVARSEPIPADPTRGGRPDWFADTTPMAAPSMRQADKTVAPLLEPRWTRAIVSGALSTRVEEGPLDLPRVVDHLARARPFRALPRDMVPTTRRGVQVLADRGAGMMPFRADVADLGDRIASVIGRHRSNARQFLRTPLLDPDEADRAPKDRYAFPRAGTPIVLLTDFGIGARGDPDRATGDDWLRFLGEARRWRTPVVAFVPYPQERVPARIREAVTVVPWDRTTSIKDVRRAWRRDASPAP